jgi:hypothetical protein
MLELRRGRRLEMWRTIMTELQPPVARHVWRTRINDGHNPRGGKTSASLIKGSVDNIWISCVLKDGPRMSVQSSFVMRVGILSTGRLMELWSFVNLRLVTSYGAVVKWSERVTWRYLWCCYKGRNNRLRWTVSPDSGDLIRSAPNLGVVIKLKTPWPSARTRTIPSYRRLSAKLVTIFTDWGCRVVSATDPRPLIRFSWPEPLLFH